MFVAVMALVTYVVFVALMALLVVVALVALVTYVVFVALVALLVVEALVALMAFAILVARLMPVNILTLIVFDYLTLNMIFVANHDFKRALVPVTMNAKNAR